MDNPTLHRSQAAIDDVSRPRRTVVARINTDVVDRYRTVIVPSGGDLRNFQRTPAVLWEHGLDPTRGRQPVGHCTSVKYRKAEDDILAVTQFKADEYSDRIFESYADGTLTSFSVDFLPDESSSSRPTPDEVRAHPAWESAAVVYRRWELTGYSAVAYPGNPEALATAVRRGLWVPDDARRAMSEGSGSGGGYSTDAKPGRRISKEDGKYVVRDESGAVLGTHDTEDDARRQLDAGGDGRSLDGLPRVRAYTEDELAKIFMRRVVNPAVALFEYRLSEIDDLIRGRI
jgi:hypothetical protein